uniref:ARAD1C05456p n=1 Tax=Blastobotrys adeninivorans TaxID=409370 RepID=A0A060SZK5_BLAAD
MDPESPTKSPAVSTTEIEETQSQLEWQVPPRTAKERLSSMAIVAFSAIALLSDGYNAQVIGYMNPFFAVLYEGSFTDTLKTRLSNAYLIGEIVGMVGFGVIIDRIGRKFGIVVATVLLVLGIVLATAAHGKTDTGMFWMMIVGRGVAGVGAGGEYPVCGTGATEATDESAKGRKYRGFIIGMVCDCAIDMGFVAAGIVAIIVIAAYHENNSSGIWRITFGLGLVLPLCVFYFRLKMINTVQYRKHAMRRRVPYMLVLKRYWKTMIGTCMTWFMYDFVSYPFGLFSSTIISQLNPESSVIKNVGLGTAINSFYIPGCLVGAYLMDKIGRKNTMMAGFFSQAILGFIIGGALKPIQSVVPLFVVLYGIFSALGEMGPGVSTFLISSESYATPLRGHLLGLSAAVGKAGAAIGTQVFTPMQNAIGGDDELKGQQGVFLVGAAFSLVGGLICFFCVPNVRQLPPGECSVQQY